jgi:hypothetical protein
VIFRLRYSELVDRPERPLRSLLKFLDKPYAADCLTPFKERTNGFNVAADFKADGSATDPTVVEQMTAVIEKGTISALSFCRNLTQRQSIRRGFVTA